VGTFLDTTVFIELERAVRKLPAEVAMRQVARRLEDQLGPEEDVAIAAITASELLPSTGRPPSTALAGRLLSRRFWPPSRPWPSTCWLPAPTRGSGRN
jgi:hypothetical protein